MLSTYCSPRSGAGKRVSSSRNRLPYYNIDQI
jgi:hypothetical protein